jgi:formylglycine-generating enzyme required for sulfatase activity
VRPLAANVVGWGADGQGTTMRSTTLLLALAMALCAACADEPAPEATPTGPAWLTQRPENAHAYADETLARFRMLVEGEGWRDPAWNAQGTLEAVHEKTGLTFVLIPGGKFKMGSSDGDDDEKPVHDVTVPAFLLSKTECTQRAWDKLGQSDENHAGIEDRREWKGEDLPIEGVDWNACRTWCDAMSFRLPSESEWEYACRAGSTGKWCFGDDESKLKDYAEYEGNNDKQTRPVGGKKPNDWGLHDMHGNVWEWCLDVYASNDDTPTDGSAHAPSGSGLRFFRGGGWINLACGCRSADRLRSSPDDRDDVLGFRPAAEVSGH